MTEPQSVAELTREVGRDWTCGCGATIRQKGFAGVSGNGAFWRPERCETCAVKHLETRQADALRERAEDGEQQERIRTLRTTLKQRQAVEALGVPAVYTAATFETFELHGAAEDQACQMRALTIGRRFCADWPHTSHSILILRGSYGTGKGHWAWSVARWLASEHAASVRVVKLSDLVRRLRKSWRGGVETEDEALAFYRTLDLLVIDEVSRHAFYGEQIHQHLYDVIDFRMECQRPTILTTNETDQGISDILRGALWDRVLGTGGVVDFGNASYRARPKGDL